MSHNRRGSAAIFCDAPAAEAAFSVRAYHLPIAPDKRSAAGLHSIRLRHFVLQHSDGVDADLNAVAFRQREGVRRDDPGAGHQKHAGREAVVTEEILNQSSRLALQFGERGYAGERSLSAAKNVQANLRGRGWRLAAQQDARSEGAASV